MSWRSVEIELNGTAPLLMHRLDPDMLEEAQGKKAKKDAEYYEKMRDEWRETTYWHEEIGLYIPSEAIEACVKQAGVGEKIGMATAAPA